MAVAINFIKKLKHIFILKHYFDGLKIVSFIVSPSNGVFEGWRESHLPDFPLFCQPEAIIF